MKTILLTLLLAVAGAAQLLADDTLQLNLVPDRDTLLNGSPQEVVVKIDLSAVTGVKKSHRTPLNLAVVIDRSGSMTGPKLEKTKQAAMQLVDRLTPRDIFSLVVFSDEAHVLVPAQKVEDKDALKEKIESIEADGSTALYAGVQMGADQLDEFLSARRINRVILLSDGLANVGPSTPRELRHLGSQLAQRGISVTTIGVGDDYNEDLMSGLAAASDANYYYVNDVETLPAIFAKELGGLLSVAARDVRIEIVCPDGVEPLGFIGRPEQFTGQTAIVNLSQFAAGQDRFLFLRCRVNQSTPEILHAKVSYTDELNNGDTGSVEGSARVNYTDIPAVSYKSVNNLVTAQKELLFAAVAKDEAIAQADGGNYAQAAAILRAQSAQLQKVIPCAPASAASQLNAEAKNLDSLGGDVGGNETFNPATRKAMQSQSYNAINSK